MESTQVAELVGALFGIRVALWAIFLAISVSAMTR